MKDYVMIPEDDAIGALEDVEPCPDCIGGRGLHVDLASGDVFGVVVHTPPCRNGRADLRLVPPPGGDAA